MSLTAPAASPCAMPSSAVSRARRQPVVLGVHGEIAASNESVAAVIALSSVLRRGVNGAVRLAVAAQPPSDVTVSVKSPATGAVAVSSSLTSIVTSMLEYAGMLAIVTGPDTMV